MTRLDLIAAIAAALFAAFLVGWIAHWIVARLQRPSATGGQDDLDRMAASLHEAEMARDRAVAARAEREQELQRRLHETEAELRAAMDGLGSARAETEELRARLAADGA